MLVASIKLYGGLTSKFDLLKVFSRELFNDGPEINSRSREPSGLRNRDYCT